MNDTQVLVSFHQIENRTPYSVLYSSRIKPDDEESDLNALEQETESIRVKGKPISPTVGEDIRQRKRTIKTGQGITM